MKRNLGISLLICVLGIISAGCSQENKVKENVNWTIVNKVDTIYKEKVPSTAA